MTNWNLQEQIVKAVDRENIHSSNNEKNSPFSRMKGRVCAARVSFIWSIWNFQEFYFFSSEPIQRQFGENSEFVN